MKVVREYPPNIADIRSGLTPGEHTVFTYGDTLYAPNLPEDGTIAEHLMVHEEIHSKQQKDPERWWIDYLIDPGFRLSQELQAYAAQYQYVKEHFNRSYQRRFLHLIASDLASPMYGGIISIQQAEDAIKNYGKA